MMKYDVETDGDKSIEKLTLNFVAPSVAAQVLNELIGYSPDDRIVGLKCNDKKGFMGEACPRLFESVIIELIATEDSVC